MRLKYKKLLLLFTMGIFGVGMVTISFQVAPDSVLSAAFMREGDPDSSQSPSPTNSLASSQAVTPTISATNTPIPEDPKALKKNAFPEINNLFETFLEAKIKADAEAIETIKACVTDASLIDFERISKKVEYITDYKNINCYTKPGTGEIDYIVYVCYDIMITKIQTGAPSIDEFYVTYQDGKPYIYYGTVSEETKTYINKTRSDTEVQELITKVDENFLKALDADEDLKEFYENLKAQIPSGGPTVTPEP